MYVSETKNFLLKNRLLRPWRLVVCLILLSSCGGGEEIAQVDESSFSKLSLQEGGQNVNWGKVLLNKSSQKTIEITRGSGQLNIFDLSVASFSEDSPFQFTGGEFPGTAGSCSSTLTEGASCTLDIEFKTTVKNIWSYPMEVSYNNGIDKQTLTINLSANSLGVAVLEASPIGQESFDYGLVQLGSSKSFDIQISNTGGFAAEVSSITFSNAALSLAPSSSSSACGSEIEGSTSCVLTLNLDTSTSLSLNDSMSITYDNSQNDITLATTLIANIVDISANLGFKGPPSFDFGTAVIGQTLTETFVIENNGFQPAENMVFSIPAPFYLNQINCPQTLGIGEECNIVVNFVPSAKAVYSNNFNLSYNNGRITTALVQAFDAISVNPAEFEALDSSSTFVLDPVDFGTKGINSSSDLIIFLRNKGDAQSINLQVSTVSPFFSISNDQCSNTSLGATGSCRLVVRYSPTAPLSSDTGTLQLSYNNGVNDVTQDIDLAGMDANLGVIQLSTEQHVYNSLVVGQTETLTLTVSNVGLISATGITPSGLAAPFEYKGGAFPGTGGSCPGVTPFDMAASTSCTVILDFVPVASSSDFSTLEFDYNDGSAAQSIDLQLFGNALTSASLVVGGGGGGGVIGLGSRAKNQTIVRVFTVTNNGDTGATLVDATLTNLNGDSAYSFQGGAYPGISGTDTDPCTTELAGQGQCNLRISFDTGAIDKTYEARIDLTYDTGIGVVVQSYTLQFTAASLGFLTRSPATVNFADTPQNIAVSESMTIQNTGQGPLTFNADPNLAFIAPTVAAFSIDFASSTCDDLAGNTLNALASCTLVFDFSSAAVGSYDESNILINYDDGSGAKASSYSLQGNVVTPALISAVITPLNDDGAYDFDLVVVGDTEQAIVSVFNTGGFEASAIVQGGLAAEYAIDATTCGATLASGAACTITVGFTPSAPSGTFLDTLTVSYNDGTGPQVASADFTGKGEPPLHTNLGWTKIFAIGNTVKANGQTSLDKKVTLSWRTMTSTGTIQAYQVFRRKHDEEFDFDTPLAEVTSATLTYTDTSSVQENSIYYYTVRPKILGFPSRSIQSFSEVRVIIPGPNKALVHHRIINDLLCSDLGETPDRNNKNICSYSGLGSTAGNLGREYDHIVDRFEVGTDLTAAPGQFPSSALNQASAGQVCSDRDPLSITGISGSTDYVLLSRQEYTASGRWDSALSFADIDLIEEGTQGSTNCNGQGGALELTGNNTDCESIFGIQDIPGNAFEWSSDRVFDGEAVDFDNGRIDLANTDLDGVDFSSMASLDNDNQDCYSPVLGLFYPLQSGSCGDSLAVGGITATVAATQDYTQAPGGVGLYGSIIGGSYSNSAPTNLYPGLGTTFWMPFDTQAFTARCGARVELD